VLRRVALLALFLAGVYLTGFVAAQLTYTVEIVRDIRWSASVEYGPTPYVLLDRPFRWLVDLFSGPTPYVLLDRPFRWLVDLFSGPTPYVPLISQLKFEPLVELIPAPFSEQLTSLQYAVTVDYGPTPYARRDYQTRHGISLLNITAPDPINLLPSEVSVQFVRNMVGGNLTNVYRPEIFCNGNCSFDFFFPAPLSQVDAYVTGGDYSLNAVPHGRGTLVTVNVNTNETARVTLVPFMEYEFVFTDYRGDRKDAVQQIIYSDGSRVNVTSNTPTLIPVYPISGIIILHERAEILGPSGCITIGNFVGDFKLNLILPETFEERCRITAYYALTTSIDATLTGVMAGVYRIGGVLKDEEGRPVQGRRVLIMLEGNLTKPVEAVTGADGSFSQIIFAPPSKEERRVFVRFPGEPGLRPSSKVLVIPGEVGEPRGLEVPPTVYGFLVAMLAAFAALILFSFIRGARRASSIIQPRRRVLR
jgi:hypothetical protein